MGKALAKIQHLFGIKMFSKLGKEENYLNVIKVMCEKPKLIYFMVKDWELFLKDQEKDKDACYDHL